jgi:hypothetical protein
MVGLSLKKPKSPETELLPNRPLHAASSKSGTDLDALDHVDQSTGRNAAHTGHLTNMTVVGTVCSFLSTQATLPQ